MVADETVVTLGPADPVLVPRLAVEKFGTPYRHGTPDLASFRGIFSGKVDLKSECFSQV